MNQITPKTPPIQDGDTWLAHIVVEVEFDNFMSGREKQRFNYSTVPNNALPAIAGRFHRLDRGIELKPEPKNTQA